MTCDYCREPLLPSQGTFWHQVGGTVYRFHSNCYEKERDLGRASVLYKTVWWKPWTWL